VRSTETDHVAWHGAPTAAPRVVDDGGRVSRQTDPTPQPAAAPTDRSLRPLARELGAVLLTVVAVAVAVWSLWTLGGIPAVGLLVAVFSGYLARVLGYWDASLDGKG
jgi:uncharacterized membrane protein YgcG